MYCNLKSKFSSINSETNETRMKQNFHDTVNMLCELLTDEPEGGSSPVPLWLFRECFKYLSELDCSAEQTFFDGKKVL